MFQLMDLKFKKAYYSFCLDLVDKIVKLIPNDVIFAGGTG